MKAFLLTDEIHMLQVKVFLPEATHKEVTDQVLPPSRLPSMCSSRCEGYYQEGKQERKWDPWEVYTQE